MNGRIDMDDRDLSRGLAAWLEDQAAATVPPALLPRVVAATSRRRPRPTWLAVLHDGATAHRPGFRPAIRGTHWAVPGPAWLVIVLLLLVLAGLLVAGAAWRLGPAPSRPSVLITVDGKLLLVGPDGAQRQVSHELVIVPLSEPRSSPSGRHASVLVTDQRELRVLRLDDGTMIGDTHGVVDYRWVSYPEPGSDALVVRQGSAVRILGPDLEPLLVLPAADTAGTLDSTPDASLVVVAQDRDVQAIGIHGRDPTALGTVARVATGTIRQLGLSPDGRWLAVLSATCPADCDADLAIVPLAGDAAVATDVRVWSESLLAWSADGTRLLVTARDARGSLRPVVVHVDGTEPTVIDPGPAAGGNDVVALRATWGHGGGTVLAVERGRGPDRAWSLWLVDPAGHAELLAQDTAGAAVLPGP